MQEIKLTATQIEKLQYLAEEFIHVGYSDGKAMITSQGILEILKEYETMKAEMDGAGMQEKKLKATQVEKLQDWCNTYLYYFALGDNSKMEHFWIEFLNDCKTMLIEAGEL